MIASNRRHLDSPTPRQFYFVRLRGFIFLFLFWGLLPNLYVLKQFSLFGQSQYIIYSEPIDVVLMTPAQICIRIFWIGTTIL